ELAGVEPEQAAEAWSQAVQAADGEQPTAEQVADAVKIVTGVEQAPPAATPVTPPPNVDPETGEIEDEPADLQARADEITHSPEVLRSKLRGDVSSAVSQVYRTLVNKYDPADL